MTIEIVPGDPRDPGAVTLLKQSHALMEELFPSEDNFYLDIDQLCAPEISFFMAREGDKVLGTAALYETGGYGEVKSMFVSTEARSRGVGEALLAKLEDTARAKGLSAMKLETGNALHAAHRLYQRAGFTNCGPFGRYMNAASSIFMEKAL